MLSSTGVKLSTSASGSQPSGNIKKDKIQQTPSSTQNNKVEAHLRKVKSSLKNKDGIVEPKGTAHVQHSKLNANSELKYVKCNSCMLSDNHDLCVLDFINNVNARTKYKSRPTGRNFTIVGNACPLTRITTTTEVPFRKPTAQDNKTYKPCPKPSQSWGSIVSDVPSSSLDTAGRTQIGFLLWECTISRLYYLEGRDITYSPVGNFVIRSLEVALSVNTSASFIIIRGINHLARHGIVRGLPKLKFQMDHLCSACALGKSKKKPHKPKSKDTNQEKLYHLHPGSLCVPMRVASVNGKKSSCYRQIPPKLVPSLTSSSRQNTIIALHDITSGPDLLSCNVVHMNNDPFFGITIPKNDSEASSSDVIPIVVHAAAPNSKHVNKWTKDHPLEQHHPVNSKDPIEAMQEELNEFECLEVWELVPRPDKVMVITLKSIYKVKLDELGGILKNKACFWSCFVVIVKKREIILRNPLLPGLELDAYYI
ncbi:hypothetical protein Tco_0870458 [Tanacetum coccineum]